MAPIENDNNTSLARRPQVIEQDEVIGIISGSNPGAFVSSVFAINPGQVSTFPWAAALAQLYERYRIEMLEFYYKPIVSGFAPSGQIGKVILSADYDAASALLTSYRQAESMDPHADGMPYEEICLRLDPRRCTGIDGKFVRQGILPAGNDIKTYDAGQLFVSVQGTTDLNPIGELRVRYRVSMMNPRLLNTGPANAQFVSAVVNASASTALVTGTPKAVALDTVLSNPGNGIGVVVGSNVATLHAGQYIISWVVQYGASGNVITSTASWVSRNGSQIAPTSALSNGGYGGPATATVRDQGSIAYTFNEGDTVGLSADAVFASGTCNALGALTITVA